MQLSFRSRVATATVMVTAIWVGAVATDILPKALKLDNIGGYEADLADPAAVYNDPSRRDHYLRMYGNICFDTRQNFINFPWSSERR